MGRRHKTVKIGVSEVKIEDYYNVKPKVEALEEIQNVEQPLRQQLENLTSPDYAYEGNTYGGKHRGDRHKCNIKIMSGNKTLFKITNKETAVQVLKNLHKSFETALKKIEKEIEKV